MTEPKLRELLSTYRDGLLDGVLPFWLKNGVDREHGGYFSSLERDGTLLDTDKSVWVQGRFSWLLSTLYSGVSKNQNWLDLAIHGLEFLDQHGTDPADGLMWFQLTREGQPLRKRRYRFSEAFACMANAASFMATGNAQRAENASNLFATFRNHWIEPSLAPGIPKFEKTRPTKSIGAPMIALNMAQVCRDSGVPGNWDREIDRCITEIRRDFVHDDIGCVMETVSIEGKRIHHFSGRTLNPGHAIEAAWFILAESKHRDGDSELRELGIKMLDWMWERGWDNVHGGILYFVSFDGKPVEEYWHDMKFWWPHNEAIIAMLMAWLLTGEERFQQRHQQVHDWAYNHFPDPENGEWFGYLNRDGSVSSTVKGNTWKGPFHLPRMQLLCWKLCEEALLRC